MSITAVGENATEMARKPASVSSEKAPKCVREFSAMDRLIVTLLLLAALIYVVYPVAAVAPQGFDWSIQDWMHTWLAFGALALILLVVAWPTWIPSDLRAYFARRKGLSTRPSVPSANGTQ